MLKQFVISIYFILTATDSFAQKSIRAFELSIQFPFKASEFLDSSLIVKDMNGNLVLPFKRKVNKNYITAYYQLPTKKIEVNFEIYFGKLVKDITDTMFFIAKKNKGSIKLSSIENDLFDLSVKDVYNFEELYLRYLSVEGDPILKSTLQNRLKFVKQNLDNPYTIELFSFFIINPSNHPDFNTVKHFYNKYLKERIKNSAAIEDIEKRIESLQNSIAEGELAPSFSDTTITGHLISNEVFKGKYALIVFWATWCQPCIQEYPILSKVRTKYSIEDIEFIAISLDWDQMKYKTFLEENNFNWTHLLNSKSLKTAFQVNPIPSIFLIDKTGIIIYNRLERKNENLALSELMKVLYNEFQY